MTSSTEYMTGGSVHDYDTERCGDLEQPQVVRSPKKISAKASKPVKISLDVQEEIDELHENVPQVEEHFTIINKIGSGTFSSVFAAKLKKSDMKRVFALKHIIPTSHPSRIENELRCLQQIGGQDSVMGVEACFRERDHVIIVMPFFQHTRFQDYVQHLSVAEVQDYMYNLLKALRRVHQCGIIHRDIKPSNFLYNRKTKKFALVDFGLAQKAPDRADASVPIRERCELNPKTKTNLTNSETQSSQRKRKLDDSKDENKPQSPRKKRLTSPAGLTEKDLNSPTLTAVDSTCVKPASDPCLKLLPPSEATHDKITNPKPIDIKSRSQCIRRTDKSPRRTVLARNALRKQHSSGAVPLRRTSDGKGGVQLQKKAVIVASGAGGKPVYRTVAPTNCQCYGKPSVCSICLARSSQHAPRAGTPGFRAPEVLLKCPDQTTAVDVWSAGVIFLSLLSGRYPFFKAPDDLTALAQIISVFGSSAMHKAALTYGKHVLSNPTQPGHDLQSMCEKLRCPKKNNTASWKAPASTFDLLCKLLDLNPSERMTAEEALEHPFFAEKL